MKLLLAVLCVCLAAVAQQQEPAPPVIRTDVQEVLVPVVVTDRKDHHITGLKAADFVVYENGVRQKIRSFRTSVDAGEDLITALPAGGLTKQSALSAPAKPDDPRRTYLICVDTLHSGFANFGRVRTALLKFFEQEHAADSQYALVALGRELKMLQDSTRDPAAVLAALRKDAFLSSIQDSEASKTNTEAFNFTELVKKYCSACGCTNYPLSRDQAPACNSRTSMVQNALISFAERSSALTEQFLDGLQRLVVATSTMPTLRTIILISDGYNRFPGRELDGIVASFGPRNRHFEFNPRDTEPRLQAILRLAVNGNIRFYTLDSRGVYTQSSLAGGGGFDASQGLGQQGRGAPVGGPPMADLQALSVARENTDVLARLAHETGGIFVENSNDMLRGIRRAFADAREYYILGYSPDPTPPADSYRKITVDVSDKKYLVVAKAGYYVGQVTR